MDADLIKSILAGLVRYALMSLFGGLITAGYVSESNILLASSVLAGGLIVVGSMVWRKVKTKYQLENTAKLPAARNKAEVKEQIAQARQDTKEMLGRAAPITKLLP